MAKVVIQHDEDPAIAVVLEKIEAGTPGRARGWYGKCTECGWPMHRWTQDDAMGSAQRHVDRHEAMVTGVDPSSVVR